MLELDISHTRNYKTKEKKVSEYLQNMFPDLTWISDKKIDGGCSKRRPDLMCDLLTHVVIIEIDEYQHSDKKIYGDSFCENKRLMQIYQDLAYRPLIVIRFNPDNYVDENGRRVTSCWTIDKRSGVCIINDKTKKAWNDRLTVLAETVKKYIPFTSDKAIEMIHLFFGTKTRSEADNMSHFTESFSLYSNKFFLKYNCCFLCKLD